MGMPGATEMIIILVIVLVIFGGGKLAGVGKSLGQGIREFKESMKAVDDDVNKDNSGTTAPKAD